MKRKYSEAFLSALDLNYVPNSTRNDQKEDSRIKKLRHWIDKAKHNKISITNNIMNNNKLETIKIMYKHYEIERNHQEFNPIIRLANLDEEVKLDENK